MILTRLLAAAAWASILLWAEPGFGTSAIDPAVPATSASLASSVIRSNFSAAASEITALQAGKSDGAASSTTNAFAKYSDTTGKVVANSTCVNDSNGLTTCTGSHATSPALKAVQSGAGSVFQSCDASTDCWMFNADGQVTTTTGIGFAMTGKTGDYAAGPGNYGITFVRTYQPGASLLASISPQSWFTHLDLDGTIFDITNANGGSGSDNNATFRGFGYDVKLLSSSGSKNLGGSSRFVVSDMVQDIDITNIPTMNSSSQILNQVNEIRFIGTNKPFSSGSSVPIVHWYSHPVGMESSQNARTSGKVVFVNTGFFGNALDASDDIRVTATDIVIPFLISSIDDPTGAARTSDALYAPMLIGNKTSGDNYGRSIHGPKMTIGTSGNSWTGAGNAEFAYTGLAATAKDAILNVYNSPTVPATANTIGIHGYNIQSSLTAGVREFGIAGEAVGLNIHATAQNIGVYGAASGASTNQNFAFYGVGDRAQEENTTGAKSFERQRQTLLTCNSGTAVCTWAGGVPAASIAYSLTSRVKTAITGCTSISIGIAAGDNSWASSVPVTLDSTTNLGNALIGATLFRLASDVVVSCNGGTFSGGTIRLVLHYMQEVAPTT